MQTKTYTPGGTQNDNCDEAPRRFALTRRAVNELITSRELILQLLSRDFLTRYRQSALGLSWVILQPLFLVSLFVAMHQAGVFLPPGLDLPYIPYALTGLALWQIFAGGTSACAHSLVEAGNMIGKVNMPRSALIFAAFFGVGTEFMIRLALAAIACLWYGLLPSGGSIILAALALTPLCLLTLGIGFFLAITAALFRDTINATTLALSGLLLLTPILYPLQPDSILAVLNEWNPLNHLITVPRDLALHESSDGLVAYGYSSLLAIFAFTSGWRLFLLAQPHIAERI